MSRILVTMIAAAALATAARGESLPGRYEIERINEGFLRLDSQTGRMAICTAAKRVWSCRTIWDDAETLRIENARLRARVAELEAMAKTRSLPTDPEVQRIIKGLAQLVNRLLSAARS